MKNDALAGRKHSADRKKHRKKERTEPVSKASGSVSASAGDSGEERDKKIAAAIRNVTEALCESEGMELVCVEYQREARGRVLRLYIDKPGGVRLSDCAYISRQVGDMLDVSTDPDIENIGPYSLEVTSPGSDRPVEKKADFEKFRGRKIKIRIRRQHSEGQKTKTVSVSIQGILSAVSGESVEIQTGHQTLSIPFQEIRRARLVSEN
jgi:ribosome maturation factor RimP